eukprot:TRINITY_DN4596_c0_g4_i1.p1 TRINITY_DN4596_c0_g4~~TRINITY_DN4596_c0_g4_i1.p1  ORF type:complete len:384 (-),score=27.79 TRINITY_DN4596_c0_g4_i1:25-1176(-)
MADDTGAATSTSVEANGGAGVHIASLPPPSSTVVVDTTILLPPMEEECPTPIRSYSAGSVRSGDVVRRLAQRASKPPQIRRPATANHHTTVTDVKTGMPSSAAQITGKLVDVLVGITTSTNIKQEEEVPPISTTTPPDDVEPVSSSRPRPKTRTLSKSTSLKRRPLDDSGGLGASSSALGATTTTITTPTQQLHTNEATGARLIRSEVEANSRESLLRTALVSMMGDGIGTTRIAHARQKVAARSVVDRHDQPDTEDIRERHQHEWVGHIQLSTRVRACSRSSKPVLVDELLTSVGAVAVQDNDRKPVSLLAEIRRRQAHKRNEGNHNSSSTSYSSSMPPRPSSRTGTVLPGGEGTAEKERSKTGLSGATSRTMGTGKLLHRI